MPSGLSGSPGLVAEVGRERGSNGLWSPRKRRRWALYRWGGRALRLGRGASLTEDERRTIITSTAMMNIAIRDGGQIGWTESGRYNK
jgi:hypothetical protein